MARRDRKRDRQDRFSLDQVPTTSFSDIAFLLIIFFILTLSMIVTEGVLTELPAGEKSEEKPEKTTTVQLHQDTLRLDDKVLSLDGLRRQLAEMDFEARKGNDRIVLFEASGAVDWQSYFEVMAAITDARATLVIVREGEGGDEGGEEGGS